MLAVAGRHHRRCHPDVGTAANVSDVTLAQALLHGDETGAFGDAGYQGVEKRAENQEVPVTWHVALRPGKRKAVNGMALGDLLERIEHAKASIRAKVEHPFHVVKNLFLYRKTRYQGLAKNTVQLCSPFSAWPIWCWTGAACSMPPPKVRPENGKGAKFLIKLIGKPQKSLSLSPKLP